MKTLIVLFAMLMLSASLLAQLADFTTIHFKKADSVAALYPNHSLRDLQKLANKLTASLHTEEEKFRSIYTWICSNIENDYNLYLVNKRKREQWIDKPKELSDWNKKFSARVFNKLLLEKKTICTGYAYLVRELAARVGLSCVIVDGYGRTAQSNIGGVGTANHSWNVVQLNGKWYLCDATWSSGAINTQLNTFVKKYDDAYFLADPSLFVRNHYPLDTAWMLLQTKPTLQEFLNRPLVYISIYKYQISQLFPETFDISTTKGKTVSFRFKKNSEAVIEKAALRINNLSPITSTLYQDSSGLYCIDHVFTSRGTHIVHVLLDANYVFTFSIKVR
jgi:transglutaminase/protease-like cytokinesis protein 3